MQIVDKIFFDPITKALKFFGKSGQMTQLGEKITWTTTPINQTLTTSEADWSNASITLSAGVWLVVANIHFDWATGSAAGNKTGVVAKITDSSNAVVQNMNKLLVAATSAAVAINPAGIIPMSFIANISNTTTYKIRSLRVDYSGTGSAAITNSGGEFSEFFAIRIG